MISIATSGAPPPFSPTPAFVPSRPPSRPELRRRHPLPTATRLASAAGDRGPTDEGESADGPDRRSPRADGTINTGMPIGWQGVGNMLFDEGLMRSGRVDLGVGPARRYRDFRGNEVVPKADPAVIEWLREALPSLSGSEVDAYAEGLSRAGFRPRSMCDLKYEDLGFLEESHRAFLYREIMGKDPLF